MSKHLRFEVEGYLLTHLQVALQFLKTLDLGRERRRWDEEERGRRRREDEEKRHSIGGLRLSLPVVRTERRDSGASMRPPPPPTKAHKAHRYQRIRITNISRDPRGTWQCASLSRGLFDQIGTKQRWGVGPL